MAAAAFVEAPRRRNPHHRQHRQTRIALRGSIPPGHRTHLLRKALVARSSRLRYVRTIDQTDLSNLPLHIAAPLTRHILASGLEPLHHIRRLRTRLALLRQEHRDLDSAIAALDAQPMSDQLQVQRLKKRKLWLRDEMQRIEDMIVPDIIA